MFVTVQWPELPKGLLWKPRVVALVARAKGKWSNPK
jgi:hypothetical protein